MSPQPRGGLRLQPGLPHASCHAGMVYRQQRDLGPQRLPRLVGAMAQWAVGNASPRAPAPPGSPSEGELQLAGRDPGHGCSQLHSSQGHIPGIAGSFAVHAGKGHPCARRQLPGPPPGQGRGRSSPGGHRGSPAAPARAELLPGSSPAGSSPGTAEEGQLHTALSRGQTRPQHDRRWKPQQARRAGGGDTPFLRDHPQDRGAKAIEVPG